VLQNNNPANAPPPDALSARPTITPQAQRELTTSKMDLLKKVLKQEEDKAYLKVSKWHLGMNLFNTVNDKINKKNEEAFRKKLGKQKKKKKKNDRKKKMERIQGVIDNNPVKIEKSDSEEESTDYELESNEEDWVIRDIYNKNKIMD
jgi:hypothetical protein